jgi:LysM repeat protein
MDRVQRSGLITLSVLLLTAVGAHFIGSRPGSEATIPDRKVAQDPAAWEGVKFLPPEQRDRFVGARDFVRAPVRHPLAGGAGRNILDGIDDPPEPPILGGQGLANRGGTEKGMLLSLEQETKRDPVSSSGPANASGKLATGPGTGRDPFRIARVREKDNLTKLAARELSNGDRWQEIAKLNELKEPYHVQVGQLLYLPEGAANNAKGSTQDQPKPINAGGSGTSNKTIPRTYKVIAGDTPGEISQKVYGSSTHWKQLLAANGIKKPEDLKLGAVLRVPELKD